MNPLDDPKFRQHCIDSANNPDDKKRYSDMCDSMAANAKQWKAANPNADVKIQWNWPQHTAVIAVISDAIEHGLVTANRDGLALLKSMATWGDESEPSVLMCRTVIEAVYEGKV